jgi:hypothetical protein
MVRINLKSILWFLLRPWAYRDFFQKVYLAIKKRVSKPVTSGKWCESQTITLNEFFLRIADGYTYVNVDLPGTPKDPTAVLLYNLAEYLQATRVIETGVANGGSTSGLLKSLKNRNGKLISTDIPSPDEWVQTGSLVPEELKKYWQLIRKPDRIALPKVLKEMPQIDLCHYDSDKSYNGRMFAYPLLWNALRKGGIFVSDDIVDNNGFKDFCETLGIEPLVVRFGDRYVGLIVKKN